MLEENVDLSVLDQALEIEIDGHVVYITSMEVTNDDKLTLDFIPDPKWPEHFTDEFISDTIFNILATKINNDIDKVTSEQ